MACLGAARLKQLHTEFITFAYEGERVERQQRLIVGGVWRATQSLICETRTTYARWPRAAQRRCDTRKLVTVYNTSTRH